jgi:alkylation response protein AidB-like acyl-CoA dehydrogenase
MVARGDVLGDDTLLVPRGHGHGDAGVLHPRGQHALRRGRRAHRRRPASRSTSRRSRAATPGAAWTSPSPTPARTWPGCAPAPRRTPTGQWRVSGEKIFITSGHGKYHFVIARTEEPRGDDAFAGLQGLSMFLVKAFDDLPDGTRVRHVEVSRLEEKLGHHGSVTAALLFDNAPAQLIGRRGEGFKYMLVLMNNARVGVAFESIGLGECALPHGAGVRRGAPLDGQGHRAARDDRRPARRDGDRPPRAAGPRGDLGLPRGDGAEDGAARALRRRDAPEARSGRRRPASAPALSRRYTPLLKYLAAEKAVEIARRNVQIHGGVGYTREYGAEKLLRDALVLPIYEGTSQIQSLMAMKDTLMGSSSARRPSSGSGPGAWRAVSATDPLDRGSRRSKVLSLSVQQHLLTRTAEDKLKTLGGTCPSPPGRHRSRRSGTRRRTSPWRCCTPSGSRGCWPTRRSRRCSLEQSRALPRAPWLRRALARARRGTVACAAVRDRPHGREALEEALRAGGPERRGGGVGTRARGRRTHLARTSEGRDGAERERLPRTL